jgi:hypothetical protein
MRAMRVATTDRSNKMRGPGDDDDKQPDDDDDSDGGDKDLGFGQESGGLGG